MEATEILVSEHHVIERMLDALEKAAQILEQGGKVRPGFFVEAADFITGFADGCHHKKEENVLFKALAENGMPEQGGPIGVMLSEHAQGRVYTRILRHAALKLADDPSARQVVIDSARGYASLLRQHMMRENRVLFPIADQFVPLEKQAGIVHDFERVVHEGTDQGFYEKYLALADALEKEIENSIAEV